MRKVPKRQQRSRRVRWGQWADGVRWQLTPGIDHEQSCRDAFHAAKTWGRRRGYRAEADLPGARMPFDTPWVLRFIPIVDPAEPRTPNRG